MRANKYTRCPTAPRGSHVNGVNEPLFGMPPTLILQDIWRQCECIIGLSNDSGQPMDYPGFYPSFLDMSGANSPER